MNPLTAARQLLNGNINYLSNEVHTLHRENTKDEQHPFAVIVGCSDSRVCPEIIFDQPIGSLFVVRTAGQVVDDIALGSIQYAIVHLHVTLVVVLGHTKCGAVTAAVGDSTEEGQIASVVNAIKPIVQPGASIKEVVIEQAKSVANKLRDNFLLAKRIDDRELRIASAIYDIETGEVELVY